MSTKNIIFSVLAVLIVSIVILMGMRSQTATLPTATEQVATTTEKILVVQPEKTLSTNSTNKMTTITMTTNKGAITLELFPEIKPATVENFTKLAKAGFYNGTRFHRVIKGFMVQGGDPLSKDTSKMNAWGTGGPGYSFKDELSTENKNIIGTISMANSGPNTNGSQFFINTANNSFLDTKHTVFGRVTAGMEVLSAIENTATGQNDRPIEDVIIEKIEI